MEKTLQAIKQSELDESLLGCTFLGKKIETYVIKDTKNEDTDKDKGQGGPEGNPQGGDTPFYKKPLFGVAVVILGVLYKLFAKKPDSL